MNADHVLRHWIRPPLDYLGLGGNDAEMLLLGTGYAETGFKWLHQIGGPGIGPFSIEPHTHTDVWRFLSGRSKKKYGDKILKMKAEWSAGHDMLYDPRYACAVARVRYLYTPDPLPTTVEGASRYWWKFYQTPGGAHQPQHYIDAWNAAH